MVQLIECFALAATYGGEQVRDLDFFLQRPASGDNRKLGRGRRAASAAVTPS